MFVSAEDTTSHSENRKKTTKKDFEINFDDDIDFDVYFRKTKVCAGFIIICAFLNYSLHSSFPFRCVFKKFIINLTLRVNGWLHSPSIPEGIKK